MSRHRRSWAACVGVLALLLAPAVTAPLAAQGPSPLLGTWSIVWGIGNRIESGVETPIKATGRMVVVAAANHPWARRRPRVDQLGQAPWILRELGSGTRQAMAARARTFARS